MCKERLRHRLKAPLHIRIFRTFACERHSSTGEISARL